MLGFIFNIVRLILLFKLIDMVFVGLLMKCYNNNVQIAILGKLHRRGGHWRPGSILQARILIINLL